MVMQLIKKKYMLNFSLKRKIIVQNISWGNISKIINHETSQQQKCTRRRGRYFNILIYPWCA